MVCRYFTTGRPEEYENLWCSGVSYGTIDEFLYFIESNDWFQLDTETTMVPDGANSLLDRELLLIQLGTIDGSTQWLIEWTSFNTDIWKSLLKKLFEDVNKTFILHNAKFDYTVIKQCLGIRVENMHDTFLMSKVANTGLDLAKGYHSLAGCLKRFFGTELDKTAQTTFTKDPLTPDQFEYAAEDVIPLYKLFLKLKELLESWNLWYVYDRVEREVVKAYADMEMNPMRFDGEYWNTLIDELEADEKKLTEEINDVLLKDLGMINHLKNSSLILNKSLLQKEDEFIANWGSNVDRKMLLIKLIPELSSVEKFTKPELKKFFKTSELSDTKSRLLSLYLDRNYSVLNRYLMLYHREWLLENEFFIEKGKLSVNWGSPQQKLFIFQYYYPKLQNTDAKALARITTNPLINAYKKLSKAKKYCSTYGRGFRDKYIRRDGTIGPSGLNQLLNTGRVAYGILLQMPGQSRFRNGFLPPEGNVFVDSDYASAELAVMASLAGEKSMLDVIRAGKDAHMFVANKLFEEEWNEGEEEGCEFAKSGKQCECKEHQSIRKRGKAFNFGIPFGMTHIGLADRLDKSKEEAKVIMDDYFEKFPKLADFFESSGRFAEDNNYIVGAPPTSRIRFFHPPSNKGDKSAINREGKNLKIQECNASMLKIALVKLRRYILDTGFPAQLHLPVHDEILSSCKEDRADEWVAVQERAMEEAADLFIEKGLLKTDTKILKRWEK